MQRSEDMPATTRPNAWASEWPLPVALVILVAGWCLKPAFATNGAGNLAVGIAFVAFFVGALLAAILATRHAEHLAERFGEPYGTLMLTLSAISLEIATVVTVMLHNADNPAFGRDTMFSVVMIVLNGIIGVALLVGGLRHHEQTYNLRGAKTFLSLLIPLATLALIWPDFTVTSGVGTLSLVQKLFLLVMSLLLYAAFMVIQTRTHTSFFVAEGEAMEQARAHHDAAHGWAFHAVLLIVYLVLVVLLAKLFALPLETGVARLGMPVALAGFAVAILVLAPEGIAAIRAARFNQMQRAMNIGLGTALSTIALTVPAILLIDLCLGRTAVLGLSAANMMMLVLTFFVSILTLGSGRTNAMQGLVHLLLFLAYVVLIFSP
ncbi:MAG: Calcium/proton antiporter [Rhodanobacteraceae bacterium]|jgi:Ca2+:H+ antiporter|nr:MAG: Calcium/proton antiporter [Rhodanobacteraceae bacterium]